MTPALQTVITADGPIPISEGVRKLDDWVTEQPDGSLVITPPASWEGLVHSYEAKDHEGAPFVAYGSQGLANYRQYLRRYIPWRKERVSLPYGFPASGCLRTKQQLLSLVTDDVDGDGKGELIAFSLVTAEVDSDRLARTSGEIAIIWQSEEKEPAVLTGFLWNPMAFTIPYVVPPTLNGGRPFLFSMEYCCAATGSRWATPVSGEITRAQSTAHDGYWQIYLDPSNSTGASMVVAKGRSAESIKVEPWAF